MATKLERALRQLVEGVEAVTNKRVIWDASSVWFQTETEIIVAEGDWEGLLHEVSHWLVATPQEHEDPNLALVTGLYEDIWEDGQTRSATPEDVERCIQREREAVALQVWMAEKAGFTQEDLEGYSKAGLPTFKTLPRVSRLFDRSTPEQRQAIVDALGGLALWHKGTV